MAELTLDHVARYPRPGTVFPAAFAFSPDSTLLTYLHSLEGSMSRVLWAFDVERGESRVLFDPGAGVTEENVSREEALRRERQRLMHTGVTHYEWAKTAPVILAPVLGDLYLISPDGTSRLVGSGAIDPHLSPDGSRVAFVRDGELWCVDCETGTERRLTHDAEPGVTNGTASYIAQEEMDRTRGFWWSADGEWLAFEHVDERHVPVFRIPHWGTDDPHDVEEHRYPFAGKENPRSTLGVVRAVGGAVRLLDLGDAEYFARAMWHPDGRLFVQMLDRAQSRLELRAYDSGAGTFQTVLVEESDVWVNLHNDLRFVEQTGSFIWSSERTGFKQLYLYDADGTLVRALTDGPFPVDAVLSVSDDGSRLAYVAGPTPVESQIFAVGLDGGAPEQLTKDPGMHGAVFSPSFDRWVEIAHSRAHAPGVTLHGAHDHVIHAPDPGDLELQVPELFTLHNRDGVELHGALYKPPALPAPLIVSVYGGPHAQMVTDSWGLRVDLSAQYLASQGFAVMTVDNRGSARRGLAFEGALKHRMGSVEIDDQVDGVAYAKGQGWVDGDRVGIMGWSYGGYMTILSMLKQPGVFRVGVSGAPVTDWDGYDTFYTEHYMGTPDTNPDGYRDASALTHAEKLIGKLLIIHGMIDENVHFRNTARFLDALAKANRSCDLMIYPNERHSPRSEPDRRNMHERIAEYFRAHL